MLINCVAYENGAKSADLDIAQVREYLGRADTFVWVALRDATSAELEQVRIEFDLHPLAVEDASKANQRPKIEEYGDALFVVMHVIEPEGDTLRAGQLAVFVGANYVVSVRNRSEQHFLGVRERCEREPQLLRRGPSYVLYALMDAIVDRYFPVFEGLESELESIEGRIFIRGTATINVERLYALKRKVGIVKHAVAPMLEVLGKLHGGRTPSLCATTQEYFRDVEDHLDRIDDAVDAIRETIGTAIAVNLSMVTIEQSDVTKRLAAWAAIFAVVTALAGIWGMNFEHMPELKWRWGYAAALAIMVSCAGLVWWRFRRSGWL